MRAYFKGDKDVFVFEPIPQSKRGRRKKDATDINVLTNADHIRSMTDEELAGFLCDATYKENEQGYPIMRTVNKAWWRKWLKQPCKEEP
jgi:hypothetical protein